MAELLRLGGLDIASGDFGLMEVDFGEPGARVTRLPYRARHGGKSVDRYYENKTRKAVVLVKSSTKDAVLSNIHAVLAKLTSDCILEWQPSGATKVSYCTVYGLGSTSKTDYSWRFSVANCAIMELLLETSPFWESDLKTASQTATTLPAAFKTSAIGGDLETISQIRLKLTSATSLAKLRIGKKTTPDPANFTVLHEAESMTLNTGTTSEADAGASGGYRIKRTPTSSYVKVAEEALGLNVYRGKYRLFVRVKNASASKNNQLRAYTAASASSSKRYCEDTNGIAVTPIVTSSSYVLVELGDIALPHMGVTNVATVADWRLGFEVKTADGTPADIHIDCYYPLPIDEEYVVDVDAIAQNDIFVADTLSEIWDCWLLKATEQTTGTAIKNFVGKIAGSMVENKNQAYTQQCSDDPTPTDADWAEDAQTPYDQIEADDGTNCTETTAAGEYYLIQDQTLSAPPESSDTIDLELNNNIEITGLLDPGNLGHYSYVSIANTGGGTSGVGFRYIDNQVYLHRNGSTFATPIDDVGEYCRFRLRVDENWNVKLKIWANGSAESGSWGIESSTTSPGSGTNLCYYNGSSSGAGSVTDCDAKHLSGYQSPVRKPKKLTFDVSDIMQSDITKLTPLIQCCGSGNGGNGVTVRIWNKNTNAWDTFGSNTSASPADITGDITDFGKYIDASNQVILEVWPTYASSSPLATTHSAITIDIAKLTVTHLTSTESGKANATGSVPMLGKGATAIVVIPEEASGAIGLSNQMELSLKYKERFLHAR